MSHLNQTLSALDLDLTQPGLKGIRPTILEVIGNEGRLRGALADVAEKVANVNARIER